MLRCLYCGKFIEKEKSFCDKKHKEMYSNIIDNVIPRINSGKNLTDKEKQLQQKFLNKKATKK